MRPSSRCCRACEPVGVPRTVQHTDVDGVTAIPEADASVAEAMPDLQSQDRCVACPNESMLGRYPSAGNGAREIAATAVNSLSASTGLAQDRLLNC